MKLYNITSISGERYNAFYDTHLKLWTVYEIDSNGYQCGNSQYFLNKKQLLNDPDFEGQKLVPVVEQEEESYWDRQRKIKEQLQMDNQSVVGFDVHESY